MTSPAAGVLPSSSEKETKGILLYVTLAGLYWASIRYQVLCFLSSLSLSTELLWHPCEADVAPPNLQDFFPWGPHSLAQWYMAIIKGEIDKKGKEVEKLIGRFERGGTLAYELSFPLYSKWDPNSFLNFIQCHPSTLLLHSSHIGLSVYKQTNIIPG